MGVVLDVKCQGPVGWEETSNSMVLGGDAHVITETPLLGKNMINA